MSYSDGTLAYEYDLNLFKRSLSVYDKTIAIRHQRISHAKMEKSWLHMLLFGFGLWGVSGEFRKIKNWLIKMYLHESYDDQTGDNDSDACSLELVRYTLELLDNLCTFMDDRRALEPEYLIVKVFVLACLAREEHLRDKVLFQCDDDYKEKAIRVFDLIIADFDRLCKSQFNEFNVKTMVDDLMSRTVEAYMGLRFEPDFTSVTTRTDDRANVNGATRDFISEIQTRFRTSRPLEDDCEHLPLPKMYDKMYGSTSVAALAKRSASISYYAVIALIINCYTNHYYNTPMPESLRYDPKTTERKTNYDNAIQIPMGNVFK
jgi:hypothetical protein